MKLISRLGFLSCLFISSQGAFAQNQTVANKNLTWVSDHNIEKHSGLGMNTEVKIIIKSATSIDLSEQGQIMKFSVQSISGTWQSENEDGSLAYSILYK